MHSFSDAFSFVSRGGFMMYPLLLSGLVALTIIFERIYTLQSKYSTPFSLVARAMSLVNSGELASAEAAVLESGTPIGNVIAAGLQNFDYPLADMELAMRNQAERWVPLLEKRVDILDTIITAAPLMGLLGTITGMMGSFQVMSEKGVNEPNAITGGVAEALIATATGLVIALVCLVAYNYVTVKIKALIFDTESIALQLIEARKHLERKQTNRDG